jgi:hypothetical protein
VKASGGLPRKTSLASARSTWSGKQTQLAITSRWKCIVAFGWPVVPEVKARRQVSSAAVSTLTNGASWRAISGSRPSGVGSPKQTMRCSTGVTGSSISSSPRSRWSQSANSTWPFSTICFSSLARSIGIGGHGDAAGLHHREPAGHQHRLVGRAQQHPVAGHQAAVLHQHVGDPVGLALQLGIGPARAAGRADAGAVAAAFLHRAVEQLGGAVEPLGKAQLGQVEQELGCRSAGGRWSRAKVSRWAVYKAFVSLRWVVRTPRSR